jgi:LuxR family maltose regulon positive regulatory protein
MTMTFFLHDSIQPNAPIDMIGSGAAGVTGAEGKRLTGEFPLLLEKLRVPAVERHVERARLNALLDRSIAQFPATMVSGRAGTGKTALLASFAGARKNIGWYTIETTDLDWPTFSRYLSCCLSDAGFKAAKPADEGRYTPQNEIASFLVRHFMSAEKKRSSTADSLIILDDVHHIFDAAWFEEFFKLMLYSLPPNAHLMLLCRSKPPAPLWRLRSKQVLNVIDEDQLAFTTEETADLLEKYDRLDLGPEGARVESFGRASKLIEFVMDGRIQ